MEDLIPLIKDKKGLRSIEDRYVVRRLNDYLNENPEFIAKYDTAKNLKQFTKSKEYKEMLKNVRAILREVYGAFIMEDYSKIRKSLEVLKKSPDISINDEILHMHRSSRERLESYKHIYRKIFKKTGKPKKILDLACGLNPFSYPYLGCSPEYLCCDIGAELMDYVQEYFDSAGIKGTAFVFDLLDFEKNAFSSYAEVDVCFLFKTLDSLETLERNFSEKLLDIPAKYLVVSFATLSLGGKKAISTERRRWFENLLEKHGLDYDFFKVFNESFYVVKK